MRDGIYHIHFFQLVNPDALFGVFLLPFCKRIGCLRRKESAETEVSAPILLVHSIQMPWRTSTAKFWSSAVRSFMSSLFWMISMIVSSYTCQML